MQWRVFFFVVVVAEFQLPAIPLGCHVIPGMDVLHIKTLKSADINPGTCLVTCHYTPGQVGYIALDASSPGKDTAYCTCLGQTFALDGLGETKCNVTCGGLSASFPGYACGSSIHYFATVYRTPDGKIYYGSFISKPCSQIILDSS